MNGTCDTEHLIDDDGEAAAELKRDTLVMGNLAYFQLRANPGLFWIRADYHTQLPSSQFELALEGAPENERYSHAVPVAINSLIAAPHRLHVVRSSDESGTKLDLSSPGISEWHIWDAFKKMVVRSTKLPSHVCTETLHIFSLASGHMYERLLRIMIASVRKHTSCPLEFWFIDNFLSPKFKQIMPAMAVRSVGIINFSLYIFLNYTCLLGMI